DVVHVEGRPDALARGPSLEQDGVDRPVPAGDEGLVREGRHVARRADRAGVDPPVQVKDELEVVPRLRAEGAHGRGRIAVLEPERLRVGEDLDGRGTAGPVPQGEAVSPVPAGSAARHAEVEIDMQTAAGPGGPGRPELLPDPVIGRIAGEMDTDGPQAM